MPLTLDRVQIAERVRRELLRSLDHGIEVERLLNDERYARDVLLVCDALIGTDLPLLAALFREQQPRALQRDPSAAARAEPGPPGHARQANDWARDTSGFGLSQPVPLGDPGAPAADSGPGERRRGWLGRWRRE